MVWEYIKAQLLSSFGAYNSHNTAVYIAVLAQLQLSMYEDEKPPESYVPYSPTKVKKKRKDGPLLSSRHPIQSSDSLAHYPDILHLETKHQYSSRPAHHL